MSRRLCRTRNTEYVLVDDLCVAVRDLRSGLPATRHGAIGQRLRGCVAVEPGGALRRLASGPTVGACLWFRTPGRDVLTTPLLAVRTCAERVV